MPADQFAGKSSAGVCGDIIFDIDDVVKQMKNALIRNGIVENTMLIFSNDNDGYWPREKIELFAHASNQGRKRQKGDVWEGGHRIPLNIS